MTHSPVFWITVIVLIVLATIIILWLKRNFQIQKVKFKTGIVETELERNKDAEDKTEISDSSINISGNTMLGRNKISVRREKSNVTKNKLIGENEIEAGAKPGPKARGRKKR